MKRRLSLVLAFVATIMSASVWADEPSVQQIAESRAAEWNAAFARGKVDDILSLYTENAILLQPNGSVSKNLREIREFWQVLIQKGVYAMDIVTARCGDDNTIITTATLSDVKTLQNPSHETMKYRYNGVLYSVFKRQPDGTWKAKVQQWSGSNPI
ncbi:MAG: hypothetical protein RLZZ226_1315 [Pseudomonadota bacterium]|jgi:ketosteroid isomerase-like protein